MNDENEKQIKVLIVDDDKIIAEVLKDLISVKGRSIDVCHDGLIAIESMKRNFYDLLITDLVMPGADGLEVLKYAKKSNPEIVVVIITGYASIETAIMAVKEGAYDYIRKPCKLEEINIVIENAVEKIKLTRENKKLLHKLQDVYRKLIDLEKPKDKDNRVSSVNFFSSSMPSLHFLSNKDSLSDNYIAKLQTLSSMKENGSLTDGEFKAFKKHLLDTINA